MTRSVLRRAWAATRDVTTKFETLEKRQLLAGVTFDNGVLKLTGSDTAPTSVQVMLSGSSNLWATAGSQGLLVAKSSVKKIEMYGGAGADKLLIDNSLNIPSYIDGSGGNDYVSGAAGNDTVIAGAGNDTVYGNGGNDSINGGDGNDYLDGGSGTNTIAGGAGSNTIRNASSTPAPSAPAPASSASISALELWDAGAERKIQNITSDATLDLAKLPAQLTLVAQGNAASVKFGVDSNASYRVENLKPWAIFGDNSGNLVAWPLPFGNHTVKVTPYTGGNATGSAGATLSFNLNIIRSTTSTPTTSGPSISALELWDAGSDKKIQNLTSGSTIDLAKLPSQLTLVAQGSGNSVKFGVDSNASLRIESAKPWAINGDNNGNLVAWNIATGTRTIKLTPYSGSGASGSAGATQTFTLNVTRSGGGGTTPTNPNPPGTDGIVPRNNSAASPNAVIVATSSKNIHAGQSVHVHATSSGLGVGTPLTARYVWDFGDPGSKYNVLQGFNAAHIYQKAGAYTLKLTVTNEAGKSHTASTTINVANAGRTVYYVSNSGSDSNSGTSTSAPLKTFAKAASKLRDNVEILFAGGQTFDLKQEMSIYARNVVVGSYGNGRATLKFSGGANYSKVFLLGNSGGGERFIRDLILDSVFTGTQKDGVVQGVHAGGVGDAILNVEFRNLGYAVNTNLKPKALLVQDTNSPLRTGLKEMFFWSEGSDFTLLGNNVSNTLYGHDVRSAGTDRFMMAYNTLSNPNDPQYGDDMNRGTINIHKGNYFYAANNTFNHGVASVGPLNLDSAGLNDKGARQKYVVLENNTVNDSLFLVLHGTEHMIMRNNIIKRNNNWAIEIQGYNSTYNRRSKDITIANNTAINTSQGGNFLRVWPGIDGINLVNNLYLAPNLVTGSSSAAPVFVFDNGLASFRKITGNVWAKATATAYAQGGYNYVWPTWSNSAGYKTPAEWSAYGVVQTDYFEKVGYNASTFAPNAGTVATRAGTVWAGVFTDKNGKIRSNTGPWTAGAIQV